MSYLGKEIPKLGFGLMRLPMLGEEVDIEQTKKMVDMFLEAGFTYFDTAYGYLGGKSEAAAKVALVDRYPRDQFQLATKLPAWDGVKTAEEAKAMFYTSLERTGAGYFDFYLLHNLGDDRSHWYDDFGLWDFIKELKDKGLIKHMGFSFHDKAAVLDDILNKHPEMEFVQLQINYADWDNPIIESRKCLEVAIKHQKPVIIMEPVKGGSLSALPESVASVFKSADKDASLSSWALRFAASQPNLMTVLSGMSTIQQMEENIATMKGFTGLSEEQMAVVKKATDTLNAIPSIPCTGCHYCEKGCPMSIPISGVFKALNNLMVYANEVGARSNYSFATRDGNKASTCLACGQCESVCPQHIHIIEKLRFAVDTFEK